MFTGIVTGTGKVVDITRDPKSKSAMQMTVNLGRHARGLKTGQSVALNGVCLTATKLSGSRCIFEVIAETIKKTNLGGLKPGHILNIERSLAARDRLEGHFVLGHIDGVGTIKKILKEPDETRVWFGISRTLSRYVVKKGSIAVDGISLTVSEIKGSMVTVSLIPHTVKITNFAGKKAGDKLNIETDILGKYILK